MEIGLVPRYLRSLRTFYYTPDQLKALQSRKLRRTIRHAYEHVPFYRKLFRERGWTPEDFGKLDDLRKIPLLTRDELVKDYKGSLMAKGMKPALVRVTSGTTGESARVAFSNEFQETKSALIFRRLTLNFGMRPWHRMVTFWDPPWRWRNTEAEDGTRHRTTQVLELPFIRAFGRPIPQIKIIQGGSTDTRGEAEALARLKPDYIFCRPTHLRRVAESLSELGLKVKPRTIIGTNEVMTDTCKNELEESFGAKVLRPYGGSEGGPMGDECRFGTGIHLNVDHYIIEVLKDGEQVAPGEMGEVTITHLHNPIMPLMRYPIGDFVELGEPERCECGSSLPKLNNIQGRVKDRIIARDGTRIAPLPIANHIEAEFGFKDFQIVQSAPRSFFLRLPRGSRASDAEMKGLRAYLGQLVGAEVDVEFQTREEREQWLKERPVVCSVA